MFIYGLDRALEMNESLNRINDKRILVFKIL